MKVYKILVIGNSFGEDATHFLHDLALTRGINTKVVNLYIGGCSLERHWRNIENEAKDYEYQLNGRATGNKVSIQDALAEEKWDYIVTQQSSHDSGWLDTYEPFMGWIAEYIKKEAPWAKFMLQETWAYEVDSKHDCFARYHRDQDEMYQKLRANYYKEAQKYGLDLIPCGDVIQTLRKEKEFNVREGGISLCRDGFHMNCLYGRYALACTWLAKIFGEEAGKISNEFLAESAGMQDFALLGKIRKIAEQVCWNK